uniref:Protection of telomeres protein 1 n=1 Tax=Ciona savignyi TaxID=51511 RepID=H2Z6G0_CIOSA
MTTKKPPNYNYLTLEHIKENWDLINQSNVYGVVVDFMQTRKSKGQDYFCILRIIDETHHEGEGVKVMLFSPNADLLPEVDHWDIIRLHRLKPSFYNTNLALVSQKGWAWVVWPKSGPVDNGKSVSREYTVLDKDKQRVNDLRKWITQYNPAATSHDIYIENITMDSYFNIMCQVIGVAKIRENLTILQVWDKTTPPSKLSKVHCEDVEMVFMPHAELLSHLCVDIMVYDNHVATVNKLNIKP